MPFFKGFLSFLKALLRVGTLFGIPLTCSYCRGTLGLPGGMPGMAGPNMGGGMGVSAEVVEDPAK